MVLTIEEAALLLGVVAPSDGSERVSGHSLRVTGAQGLIHLGWRADAVQLMGRWMSRRVQLYTRLAPLAAPWDASDGGRELRELFAELCGSRSRDVVTPPAAAPEPPEPEPADWIMNAASDVYHLIGPSGVRTRCGWRFTQGLYGRGSAPPPWDWVICGTCAPAFRQRLRGDAPSAAP